MQTSTFPHISAFERLKILLWSSFSFSANIEMNQINYYYQVVCLERVAALIERGELTSDATIYLFLNKVVKHPLLMQPHEHWFGRLPSGSVRRLHWRSKKLPWRRSKVVILTSILILLLLMLIMLILLVILMMMMTVALVAGGWKSIPAYFQADADYADYSGINWYISTVSRWVEERPSLRVVVAFRKPYAGAQLTLCRCTQQTQHIDLPYISKIW